MPLRESLEIKFANPLQVNMNVNMTYNDDARVAALQKEIADILSGAVIPPELQAKITEVFDRVKANTAKMEKAIETDKQ